MTGLQTENEAEEPCDVWEALAELIGVLDAEFAKDEETDGDFAEVPAVASLAAVKAR